MKINKICPENNKYTEVLCSIAVVPKILYYYGKIPENRIKSVAIVGSRHNTKYGEEIAYKLAFELAKRGVIVVSGLAYGIDSIAHRGALDAHGVTLAVLGTEIEKIYPKEHVKLAEEIVEKGGAVMSEYRESNKVLVPKWTFLERNRIVSGLSDAVIIVEAAERSGSLNTAMHALEQGKQVFAVPGNITSLLSVGCNKLIRQGAEPLTEIKDAVDFFFPPSKIKTKQPVIFGDSEEETEILKLICEGVNDGEEIIERLKMSSSEFNQVITMLEIKGMVRGLGMNKWAIS